MICNHDGEFFPNLYLDKETKDPLEFDRILADVPCTGDGTTRKNIDVWKTWSPRAGLGLHPVQIRILERCLSMLKTGGRIVYSTCSYNPVENEAVVAHILKKYAGKIKLVDVSDRLVGLKYRKGLSQWRIIDKTGIESFHPDRKPEGHENDPNFRVPLSAYSHPEYAEMDLDRCIRVLPHDQNSGGFFIVLLEKVAELGTEKSRGHRKRPMESVAEEQQVADVDEVEKKPPTKKGRFNNADEEPFSYLPMDSPIIKSIVDFFGFNTEILNRGSCLVRSCKENPKNLYFVSEPISKLVDGCNSVAYIELLKEYLIPEIKAAGAPMTFMHDNASCHKTDAVSQFLAEENVPMLPWPPQCQISTQNENLWAIIKARLRKKFSIPKTLNELFSNIIFGYGAPICYCPGL
jgi:multisite-specific tRNA:(cytosine-C5)-methyltransferase